MSRGCRRRRRRPARRCRLPLGAAERLVEGDAAVDGRGARAGLNGDAASQAVAALAALAAGAPSARLFSRMLSVSVRPELSVGRNPTSIAPPTPSPPLAPAPPSPPTASLPTKIELLTVMVALTPSLKSAPPLAVAPALPTAMLPMKLELLMVTVMGWSSSLRAKQGKKGRVLRFGGRWVRFRGRGSGRKRHLSRERRLQVPGPRGPASLRVKGSLHDSV